MPGVMRRLLVLHVTALALGLVLCVPSPVRAAASDAETENWNRLRAMPREMRLALWEKLKEFDALSPSEKTAIRSLSARIAQLPAAEQASYWVVLRRYHHWVQGLSDEQRSELSAVPIHERMRLVSKLRAQERTGTNATGVPLFLQVIDFTAMSPFESALRIKGWLELTPEQRAEIELLESPADQLKRLAELAPHVRLPARKGITKAEEDALMPKLEAIPQLKTWLGGSLKKSDPAKHEKARRRIASNYYFFEKPPEAVEPGHLTRFAAALPPWNRGQFDHLPAEEARRRLTILYRLIFPAPSEMPEIPKSKSPPGTTPAPAPTSPKAAPAPSSNPF